MTWGGPSRSCAGSNKGRPGSDREQASQGEVADAEFLDCVRISLPYAWDVVTGSASGWAYTTCCTPGSRVSSPSSRS